MCKLLCDKCGHDRFMLSDTPHILVTSSPHTFIVHYTCLNCGQELEVLQSTDAEEDHFDYEDDYFDVDDEHVDNGDCLSDISYDNCDSNS